MFNILYNNVVVYKELTEEECRNVLMSLAEKVADGIMDKDLIDVEEI